MKTFKDFILVIALIILAQSCSHNGVKNDQSSTSTQVDNSSPVKNEFPNSTTSTNAGFLSPKSTFLFAFNKDAKDIMLGRDSYFLGDVDDLGLYRKTLNGKLFGYVSVGSWESYRDDEKLLKPFCLKKYKGYPDECHLDLSKWRLYIDVMFRRIDKIKSQGYDGFYTDNMGMFDDGLGTLEDNIEYAKQIVKYAHFHGLLVGFNNAANISRALINDIDFQVLESCNEYKSCDEYLPVVNKGLPVFHIEFKSSNCYGVKGHQVGLYGSHLSELIKDCK